MTDEAPTTPPFSQFEWMLSMRYLRSKRREGFISFIAVISFLSLMIGVAALIIVMAVMNGLRKELLDKTLGLNGHLNVEAQDPPSPPLTDWAAVAERLAAVPGVQLAAPVVDGQALASSPFSAGGVRVRGMRGADLARLGTVRENIRSGTLEDFDDGGGIAIGERLADQLSLTVGDDLTLVSPRGAVTPMGITPRIKPYRVAAIFRIGLSDYDSGFVFMPLKDAQVYFSRPRDVTAIEVHVDDPESIAGLRPALAGAAGRPVRMVDWRDTNRTLFGALKVERNVMFLVLSLLVLVAALSILSALNMLVKEKTRNIAILRTMGATRGAVMRVFVITGTAIGVVGTLTGLLFGSLFCLNIENLRQVVSLVTGIDMSAPDMYFLSRLPARMDPVETTAVVALGLVLSFLATLVPSWRAARLDPVEGLRG